MKVDPKKLINIRFVLRTDQNPDRFGRYAIHMILSKGKGKCNISAEQKCTINEWDSDLQLPVDAETVRELEALREQAFNTVLKLYLTGKGYTPAAVKHDMRPTSRHATFGVPTLQELYMDRIRRKSKGKYGYTKETFRNYKSRWTRISGFLRFKFGKSDIPLKWVTQEFAREFDDWMLTHEDPDLNISPLSPHTAVNIHKKLKATFREAILEGIEIVNPYDYFELREKPSDPTYLTKEELQRVMEVELPNETAEVARDYFVFSAFTAFRIKDATSLTWDNIIDEKDGRWIRLREIQKTDVPNHEIPALPPANDIIEKYRGCKIPGGFILPRIAEATINRWLKVVGAMAGIKNKNLSHNVSRHTCATTVLMEGGADIPEIQRFMGHLSPKSTMVYAKVTRKRLANINKAYQKFCD